MRNFLFQTNKKKTFLFNTISLQQLQWVFNDKKKEYFDLDQSVRYDQPNVAPLIPKTHLSDVWILKAETKR